MILYASALYLIFTKIIISNNTPINHHPMKPTNHPENHSQKNHAHQRSISEGGCCEEEHFIG